jgi:hypothetical protein
MHNGMVQVALVAIIAMAGAACGEHRGFPFVYSGTYSTTSSYMQLVVQSSRCKECQVGVEAECAEITGQGAS